MPMTRGNLVSQSRAGTGGPDAQAAGAPGPSLASHHSGRRCSFIKALTLCLLGPLCRTPKPVDWEAASSAHSVLRPGQLCSADRAPLLSVWMQL